MRIIEKHIDAHGHEFFDPSLYLKEGRERLIKIVMERGAMMKQELEDFFKGEGGR